MPDAPIEVTTRRVGDAIVVAVGGEVDMATAPALSQALELARVQEPARVVVVDLTEVGFLDSSALNALVRCQRRLSESGVGFCLVSPGEPALRRIFEITRLTEPLNLVDSLEQALA